jgi:predicted outer membrane repeat protein
MGGAIYTTIPLIVDGPTGKSTFEDNQAEMGRGGAIAFEPRVNSTSMMDIQNATFKNNTARVGGAVYTSVDNSDKTVEVSITGSLFDGNHALTAPGGFPTFGGGLSIYHTTTGTAVATVSVTNSTFYNNDSTDVGGGIWMQLSKLGTSTNTAILTSLTVTKNTAGVKGGGLLISSSTTTPPEVLNSIIAENLFSQMQPAANGIDVSGNADSKGFNLIGVKEGGTEWVASDRTGQWGAALDPLLDPNGPMNNGGLTKTIKLMAGSVAYQNGKPGLAGTKDQRGYTRRNDATHRVSIGAFDPDAQAP